MPSVRIPENKGSRNTIYFDESGIPSLKNLEEQDFKHFILTGVVSNNYEFEKLEAYYYKLKMKYFGKNKLIHSAELFRNPSQKEINYIKELSLFLDSIPFYSFTVIVDKEKVYSQAETVSASNPFSTNIHKLKSIWKQSFIGKDFKDLTIDESITLIQEYRFKDINMLYPLQTAFKKILEQYTDECIHKLYNEHHPQIEICFESSPFRKNILTEIEKYTHEKDISSDQKTLFAVDLERVLFNISFPNKKAKYMGLEIADLISYGYYLKQRRELKQHPSFAKIWKIIKKREDEFLEKDLVTVLKV